MLDRRAKAVVPTSLRKKSENPERRTSRNSPTEAIQLHGIRRYTIQHYGARNGPYINSETLKIRHCTVPLRNDSQRDCVTIRI